MGDDERWPDLDLLQDLDVLLEECHVTRAAKKRGITQSAMSARLSKLRIFFDDVLLVDARPKLLRSARAEALRTPLRAALRQLASVMTKTASFDPKTSTRTFTLVGGDATEAIAIPRLLAKFRDAAPGVTLHMRRATVDLQLELGERGGDIAFEPMFKASSTLQSTALAEDPFVVMMRAKHSLANKPLTLSSYLAQSHILIAPSGLPGSIVDDALSRLGKSRRVVAILRHFTSAPIVVARSDVLLTCPQSLALAVQDIMPFALAAPPLELPTVSLRVIWHERCQDDPAHIWLREMVRETQPAVPLWVARASRAKRS
jgi:DNA-binding transcriptional LysR family regulator